MIRFNKFDYIPENLFAKSIKLFSSTCRFCPALLSNFNRRRDAPSGRCAANLHILVQVAVKIRKCSDATNSSKSFMVLAKAWLKQVKTFSFA